MRRQMLLSLGVMLFLAYSIFIVYAKPSRGLSHYDPTIQLYVTGFEPKTVALGLIKNTGDVDLNVTCIWTQTSGSESMPIQPLPQHKVIGPGESFEPKIRVIELTSNMTGHYAGYLELMCHTIDSGVGSGVAAGGVLECSINVDLENPNISPPEDSGESEANFWIMHWPLLLGATLLSVGVIGVLVHKRKNEEPIRLETTHFL